jgi:hypothetical protein
MSRAVRRLASKTATFRTDICRRNVVLCCARRLPSDQLPHHQHYDAVVSTFFFAYFLLYRSTRPAESTSFCRPVKKGWQFEQISIFRSPTVDRVSNVLPQTQVTVAFL